MSAGNSNSDQLGGKPVHRGTAKHSSPRVVQVAVCGVGFEQLRHLDDQALQDGLHLELARHHLRRLDERRLTVEPPAVLLQELRGVEGETDFAGDRLGERDFGLRPVPRL